MSAASSVIAARRPAACRCSSLVQVGIAGMADGVAMALIGSAAGDRCGADAGQPRDHRRLRRDAAAGLDLREGVPAHLRTLVAVPTLLTTRAAIEEQIERLEVHYLANPAGEIHFALLSDWTDARRRAREGDADLLAAASRTASPGSTSAIRMRPAATLPAAPPPPRLERGAGQVDRLGAQARQAARAQSPAARRDRHDVPRQAEPRLAAGRRPLRRHPRRRHATAARRGPAAGRQDGASAQPAASRPVGAASSKATACCSRASRRRCRSARKARCSSASSPAPAASIPTPRRSPTSTRTCSARAPTPARASTTSMPSRPRCRAACPTTRC